MITYYYVERTHQIWKQLENSITEEMEGQTTNIQVNNKKYIYKIRIGTYPQLMDQATQSTVTRNF